MHPLKDLLTKRLEGARRLAILAVGSSLRGDDGAGLRAADELQRLLNLQTPPAAGEWHGHLAHESRGRLAPANHGRDARETHGRDGHATKGDDSEGGTELCPVQVAIFVGETAPENLTGEIKRFQPTHLVILDAADFGGAPGQAAMISPEEIRGNPSISSHNLPLNVLTDYLVAHLHCEVMILGVQPASSRFGQPIGEAAGTGATELAQALCDCVRHIAP